MIKKILMKLLGVPTRAERLAALEVAQASAKESIDGMQGAIDRLVELHDNAVFEGEMHRMQVAQHIELAKGRLAYHQAQYAGRQMTINILRATVDADNVKLSLK